MQLTSIEFSDSVDADGDCELYVDTYGCASYIGREEAIRVVHHLTKLFELDTKCIVCNASECFVITGLLT